MKKIALKKCLTVFLAAIVIASFSFPGGYAFADVGEESTVDEILNQDENAPESFETATDPYGIYGTDKIENVLTQNELCLLWNNKEGNNGVTYEKFNDLNLDNIGKSSTSSPYFGGTLFEGWTNGETVNNYQASTIGGYVQNSKCTAYDSDGDGIRESIASVGWDGNSIWIWTYNTITDQTNGPVYGGYSHQSALEDNGQEWRAHSFFSITAGDYDGDGKESIVVAVQRFNGVAYPSIQEWKVNDSYELVNVFTDNANWVNQAYLSSGMADTDFDYEDLLSMQLATGDFNDDGIDDLACLSYTNDMSNGYDDESSIDLYVPWLATGLGVKNSGLKSSPDKMTAVKDGHDCPAAAGIACGDINNDGVDEIIIAGYKNYVSKDDDEYSHDFDHVEKDKQIIAAYTHDKGVTSRTNWQVVSSNKWSSGHDWFGESDFAFPVVGVSTAALDGVGGAESIFIDGTIYTYNLKSGSGASQFQYEFQQAYTPGYFNSVDDGVGGWTISATYIQDVVAGSFDEDTPGQQQFIGLVACKHKSYNEYRYIPVIIGKKTNDDGTTSFYCNDVENTQNWSMEKTRPVAHVAAIDCDNDGLSVRMSEKTCIWTDPEVIGVLQAPPYFGELGSYDDFNDGATTVEFSTSYETGQGTSKSQNIGAGLHTELETAVCQWSIDVGYSGGWEQSVFDSTETETTVSYTTGALDTVIVKRTPVYCYLYDTIDPTTGEWEDDSYMLTVTQTPQYYQLSLDEYKDFADRYNEMLRVANAKQPEGSRMTDEELEKLKIWAIDNTVDNPLHKEGNPCMYKKGAVSDITFNLAYAGGSQAVTYAKSQSHEVSSSQSHGFTFNTSLLGKAGDDSVAAVKVGGYFESEFTWGSETSTTTTNGTSTSGEVCNIHKASTASALGISQTDVSKYGFQWSFGSWDIYLGAAGYVPVYGYGLANIKTLHSKVTDVDAYGNGDEYIITWNDEEAVTVGSGLDSATSSRALPIKGYDVYINKNNSWKYDKLNSEPVTSTEFAIPEGTVTEGDEIKIQIVKIAGSKEDGSAVAGAVPAVTDNIELQTRANINDKTISLDKDTFIYEGKAIEPKVTVDGLTEGEDYQLTYSDNVDAGTASVKVVGIGDYAGTKTLSFAITPCDISKKNVKVSGTTKTYTGKTQYPNVTISGLTKNTDFTVSGAKAVGKNTITIKGKGNYTGTKTVYLTIKPKKASVSKLTLGKTGSKKLTVKMGTKASSTGGTTYKVQYRVKGTSSWKTKTTTSQTITLKSLKKGKTYQVRVCAYKKVSGKIYTGAWSAIKTSGKIK